MFEADIKLSLTSLRHIFKGLKVSNQFHLHVLRGTHRIILYSQQVINLHKEEAELGKMLICKAHNSH